MKANWTRNIKRHQAGRWCSASTHTQAQATQNCALLRNTLAKRDTRNHVEQKGQRIRTIVCAESDLSSLFEGSPTKKQEEKAAEEQNTTEVELKSDVSDVKFETRGKLTRDLHQAGLSYERLRDLLSEGEWEKADEETRMKLIDLAGEEAQIRGWVYFTEVKEIPVADLQTIDALWKSYSNGRYGFSVQKKIWLKSKKVWTAFFQKIDWVQGENNAYRKFPLEFQWDKEAAVGHLPLTNALRGTQLLEAVFKHPAFAAEKKKVSTSIKGSTVNI